ncbi:MAG: hypothetical protein ACYTG5_12955 [Planctomycetota bacterium]|jgi:hypothetical protein
MRSTGIALAVALVFGMGVRTQHLSFTQDSHSMWTRYWGQVRSAASARPHRSAHQGYHGSELGGCTAEDHCSYRPDADNSRITADRLTKAIVQVPIVHRGKA